MVRNPMSLRGVTIIGAETTFRLIPVDAEAAALTGAAAAIDPTIATDQSLLTIEQGGR